MAESASPMTSPRPLLAGVTSALPPAPPLIWWRVYHRTGEPSLIQATEHEIRGMVRIGNRKCLGFERARIHQCSVCGTFGPWGETWGWYGSYKMMDDGKEITKICSAACLQQAQHAKIIPLDLDQIDEDWP